MTIYECDGCGKQERCPTGDKPHYWFARNQHEDDGALPGASAGRLVRVLHACSRECIGRAAGKHGGHDLVLPL